jgi:hypothetical protein
MLADVPNISVIIAETEKQTINTIILYCVLGSGRKRKSQIGGTMNEMAIPVAQRVTNIG